MRGLCLVLSIFLLNTALFVLGDDVSPIPNEIIGPDTVATGRLASFYLPSGIPAAWCVIGPTDGVFSPDTGDRIYFASPIEGQYKVIAAIVDGGAPKILLKEVFVGKDPAPGPGPSPEPGPGPGPSPKPDNLAEWVAGAVAAVNSANKKQEALAVASSLEAVAAAIKEGKITTPRFAREQTRAITRARLGNLSSINAWAPFSDGLDKRLDEAAERGELKTVQDYAAIWENVAAALRKVL